MKQGFVTSMLGAMACLVNAYPTGAQTTPLINEFMAANSASVQDPQGQYDDWIELYNPADQAVDISGMYLTDDLTNPTKWRIPEGVIPASGHLLIWTDRDIDDEGLHASFSLSSRGEAIGLYDADGITLLDNVTFAEQIADTAWGRSPDGSSAWGFMHAATPDGRNGQAYAGVVAPVTFSTGCGFYDQAVTVELGCATPGAQVWYTLDTTLPHSRNPRGRWLGTIYDAPISIDKTQCIRAVAVKPEWKDSPVRAHTYILLDDVIRQDARPDGFPREWGGNRVDYAMDQQVVNDPAYRDSIKEDLKSIPSLCIVMDNDDFFGAQGIYANAQAGGVNWERLATIEWIDLKTDSQFGVNAGLRVHGGAGRNPNVAKHGLRILFKNEYGPATFSYPLFKDSEVSTFDSLVLRACWNYSWIGHSGMSGPRHAQYMRDAFSRDTTRDMGQLNPYGRHVHVYVNGLYWGVYILIERPDDGFAAQHLGGDKDDYDVLKASNSFGSAQMEIVSGDLDTWYSLFDFINRSDLSRPEAYQAIQQYVDIPSMIDYMLMVFYVGSRDAPTLLNNDRYPRNFYTLRRREPQSGFIFLPWDVEWCLEYPTENRVTRIGGEQNPGLIFRELGVNAAFRQLVGDHVHRHFYNNGALSVAESSYRYWSRSLDLDRAVVGESARWGDSLRARAYTRDIEWMTERDRLMDEYFPVRTGIVLNQLKAQGWYPALEAPIFYINDEYQHGGYVPSDSVLSMVKPNGSGTIYYTLDGSDPRTEDIQALDETVLIPQQAQKRILIPLEDMGDGWTGLDFDDTDWITGTGGVGFDLGWDYTEHIGLDILDDMWAWNASCYMRVPFDLDDVNTIDALKLKIRFDDGFAAYINGTQVAQHSAPVPLEWDSASTYANEAGKEHSVFEIPVTNDLGLQATDNILAIQGLNASATSSDFLLTLELTGSSGTVQGAQAYQAPIHLDKSDQVKACVLEDGQWSALNEAVYGVGPVAQSLALTELMYHPEDPNAEFIELTNLGSEVINLNRVQFVTGVRFVFGDISLVPNESTLVLRDISQFETLYGTDLPVAGQFEGNLSNSAERIEMQDALGKTMVDFQYTDAWYRSTDGDGLSLVLVDPNGEYSNKGSWYPSHEIGGSPGHHGP